MPMRSKRVFVSLTIVFSMLLGSFSASAETSDPDFSFNGSGWGHGVGLSQYGAKALAADGATYSQIVSRYFPDTNLNDFRSINPNGYFSSTAKPVLVGLIQNSGTVSFKIDSGSAQLCFDKGGNCVYYAQTGSSYRFSIVEPGLCSFFKDIGQGEYLKLGFSGGCDASVKPVTSNTKVSIPFKARSYGGGILRFHYLPSSGKIHTAYQLDVEDYLKGLSEVPEFWPDAAIESQVIVSRSYAVWKILEFGTEGSMTAERKKECYCNLKDDSTDQIFRGWTGEEAHPSWVRAVSATSNTIITYQGKPALGLHSSSSGGKTESYFDVFESLEHPYLQVTDDSAAFSISAGNPHAVWKAGYDQETIAETFGFSWVSNIEVTDRNLSGSAKTIRITGVIDGTTEQILVKGTDFRSLLSMRSTTFDVLSNPRFKDVSATHTFAGEILGLYVNGITKGCETHKFCPNQQITRAEMAAFLVRALNLPSVPGEDPYKDDDGHIFENEISTLYVNGITKGCETHKFCPNQQITRAEMAAFLVRAIY